MDVVVVDAADNLHQPNNNVGLAPLSSSSSKGQRQLQHSAATQITSQCPNAAKLGGLCQLIEIGAFRGVFAGS